MTTNYCMSNRESHVRISWVKQSLVWLIYIQGMFIDEGFLHVPSLCVIAEFGLHVDASTLISGALRKDEISEDPEIVHQQFNPIAAPFRPPRRNVANLVAEQRALNFHQTSQTKSSNQTKSSIRDPVSSKEQVCHSYSLSHISCLPYLIYHCNFSFKRFNVIRIKICICKIFSTSVLGSC